jgi:hypothetical protein
MLSVARLPPVVQINHSFNLSRLNPPPAHDFAPPRQCPAQVRHVPYPRAD